MAENLEPAEPHGPPDPLILTPLTRRGQAPAERPALPPDIEEQFNHLRASVQLLSAHFLGEPESSAIESLKERTARRVKKFHRASGDERAAAPGEDPAQETTADPSGEAGASVDESAERLALNKHIAWPRRTDAWAGTTPEAGLHRWWERRPTLGVLLGAQALGLFLLVAGYLLGHATAPSATRARGKGPGDAAAADLFDESESRAQALQIANDGLQAEHSSDPDKARKIYESALTKHLSPVGTNYRLALLAVQRNDRLDAEQRLERSRLDGENVADSCYVLARLAADKGDFEEAATQLQRATLAQPFNGRFFFYWGELLRRQGKPQAAVAAFEQALVRPYTAESGDLYLFKQRLAKVEFGHDEAFSTELADHLKAVPVGAEWLLLAAAQELDQEAYPAAAEHLRQASDRMPAAIYAGLTHDYFFQTYAKRSEVASLLSRTVNLDISAAGPTVLDPGSWSPERGDPGTWASATK